MKEENITDESLLDKIKQLNPTENKEETAPAEEVVEEKDAA